MIFLTLKKILPWTTDISYLSLGGVNDDLFYSNLIIIHFDLPKTFSILVLAFRWGKML